VRQIIRIFLLAAIMASSQARAEKISYQNWVADLNGKSNEAYTIADQNTSFGVYCASEQCLFYLHQSLNCTPGAKYSVLINSPSISTALNMECTLINGNIFQILTPFNAVLKATQAGESVGFAVALQSGAFAVTRFNLQGAKQAIDKVLTEAAASKQREQRQAPPPQILIVPPIQIVPQAPQKPPQNVMPKPPANDISI
jgi:hypothetical protein